MKLDKSLTQRELDCIYHLLRGKTAKEIGKNLGLSYRTVESYVNQIKVKWGCQTKPELLDYVFSKGLCLCTVSTFLEEKTQKFKDE